MLSLFITLFFLSIVGMIVLITRKLLQIEKLRTISENETFYIDVPELEEVHHVLARKIKRGGYVALVLSIRGYLIGMHFTKKTLRKTKNKIFEFISKYRKNKIVKETKKEASGFLKTISEYKKKVNKITEKIKEEEGFEI